MTYKFFQLEKVDGVGIVTMNRPPVNALSLDFTDEMKNLVTEVDEDSEVRCVLFRSGIAKFFCAGFDLTDFPPEMLQKYTTPQNTLDMKNLILAVMDKTRGVLKEVQNAFLRVENISKPTIAAINGLALGGGLEFALACDFRFMGGGKAGLTEVILGLIPLGGGTQRLPRLIGKSRAMDLILNGTKMNAAEALSMGVVDKIFDQEKLDEESLIYAKRLAAGATRAMSIVKKCVSRGLEVELSEGLKIESDSYVDITKTEDLIEGVTSFIEKRKPNFLGK